MMLRTVKIAVVLIISLGLMIISGDLIFKNKDWTVHDLSVLGLKHGIKVDANGDGDLDDEEDYIRYTHILITDTYKGVSFRPLYIIEPPGIIKKMENFRGTIIKINGREYFVVDVKDYEISITDRFIKKRVYVQQDFSPDKALKFNGMSFGIDSRYTLYVIKNGSIIEFVQEYDVGEITHKLESIKGYRVFVMERGSNYVELALVEIGNETELSDGMENVFGYEKVYINSEEVPKGENRIVFVGKEYSIRIGKKTEVKMKFDDPPYYYFKMDYEKKKLSAWLGSIPKKYEKKKVEKKPRKGIFLKNYVDKIRDLTGMGIYPTEIRIDANNDGDFFDKEDYTVYNKIHVLDAGRKAVFRLVYFIEAPSIGDLKSIKKLAGRTVKIMGKEYLVLSVDENKLEIAGDFRLLKLNIQPEPSVNSAQRLYDDIKAVLYKSAGKKMLSIYRGEDLIGAVEIKYGDKDISGKIGEISEDLREKMWFVVNQTGSSIFLALINRSSLITVLNEEKALGYEKVVVKSDGIYLYSKTYKVERNSSLDLDELPYRFVYDREGYLWIERIEQKKAQIAIPETHRKEKTNKSVEVAHKEAIKKEAEVHMKDFGIKDVDIEINMSSIIGEKEIKVVCGPTVFILIALIPLIFLMLKREKF